MFLGNYINGQFVKVKPGEKSGEWRAKSPADLSDELGVVAYSFSAVDEAVSAAEGARVAWRKLAVTERAALLKRYQEQLRLREKEFCNLIAREVGKPIWEGRTEVTAMVNKVDITIEESLKLVQSFDIPNIMADTTGSCRYRPHGVMAVIGPFNFPGHLPNGHIVPALLTGNTVVFKPSEKTPAVGQLMAECFHAAGIPPGVFNLLQGEKEVGRRLSVHPAVSGVLFTGSYEVGTRIKQDTLQQHWKILALEMGGKNSTIVWSDADVELAVYETLVSGFITAGQRCSATSRVIVHQSLLEKFIERLHERAKAFKIGHWSDDPFMGPLIDSSAVDRYLKFIGVAAREGCELIMRGKALEHSRQGFYVTPSIAWVRSPSLEHTKKSVFQQTELFAPALAVLGVASLEEAILQANETQYGLVASVFSKSRAVFEECREGLEVGLVNWNKSTVGASSRLPFGGFKKSGNHFPTALTSTLYCASPVSSLELSAPPSAEALAKNSVGLNWFSD
ncbi:MAG: succinylglutamate-semialdehyde dehydrogenase [Bdellovibrionales bacterium]|nr:succinylglutamate-semialdehyde dehydrogenase [Bdellovibrionales bacterium]